MRKMTLSVNFKIKTSPIQAPKAKRLLADINAHTTEAKAEIDEMTKNALGYI